ncbi:hypothetical protein ONZ45_g119 [Pleurotus djamor]|nr:hypothetical protein ONZ45_g119 [Pleurotus djamor]
MTDHTSEDSSYIGRAKNFVELHDQVQSSVHLLDSLESFLSTFQKDLSVVAGQISELQDRSKDIGNRLKSRKKIEKPLSQLISDIVIPPPLATLILDTDVGEPWIVAIGDFEKRLETVKARSRVKAARDLAEIIEGLRIVAATKLRAFFLALFQPIRSSVSSNMQVIQTSVLMKYKPLLSFLQRQAPNVFLEIQRSYIGAARTYYETGFRRYIRALTSIKARTIEKPETIVSGEKETTLFNAERLDYAKIDGLGVTLAYMADDKNHKEPMEALLRSLLLVLLDNATAEYTFITSFFANEPLPTTPDFEKPLPSPLGLLSPNGSISFDNRSVSASEDARRSSTSGLDPSIGAALSNTKAERAGIDALWKQTFDPVMEYTQTFLRSLLDPAPPIIPLLVMIRLTEAIVTEIQVRMWPVFQKLMTENIEALKKVAEGSSQSYFSRAPSTTDASVIAICKRYIVTFNSFVSLTEQAEETMIFANLLRLRQEVTKLISKHAEHASDPSGRATMLCKMYAGLLQGFTDSRFIAHPKAQQEIAYWSNLDEEAKRKAVSITQARSRR